MSIITFLVVLAILVLVHEFGHFIVAKKMGVRVDEFAIGFPPRIISWKPKNSETTYAINLIPFGGYVKIFGENPDEDSISGPDSARSFVNKKRSIQVAVLSAGVIFNLLFAWLIISSGYMIGLPTSISESQNQHIAQIKDAHVVITTVLQDSPASKAGMRVGDTLLFAQSGKDTISASEMTAEKMQNFISSHSGQPITILERRGSENQSIIVVPQTGIVEGKAAIGIAMDLIGTLKLSPPKALYEGLKMTGSLTKATAVGLGTFLYQAVTGRANFSEVTGPIGIAGLVGSARELGLVYLLSLMAFISINLAVLNLVPVPALDGGRILFVLIEAVRRKSIPVKVANTLNSIGFILLILLMLIVTYKDIVKLVVK